MHLAPSKQGSRKGAKTQSLLRGGDALPSLLMLFSAHHAAVAFKKQRSSPARATGHADSFGNTKRRLESKAETSQHARAGPSLSHSFKYRQRRVSRTASRRPG